MTTILAVLVFPWQGPRVARPPVFRAEPDRVSGAASLGDEARINVPTVLGGNWDWRMREGAITRTVEETLLDLTQTYFRVPGARPPELPA